MNQPTALHILLANLVDYAGLFPPAQLAMRPAVHHYTTYLSSDDAWALGRFIVPAARLTEFAAAYAQLPPQTQRWQLSVLLADVVRDVERLAEFRAAGHEPIVDTVEFKANTPGEIRTALEHIPPVITSYVELPLNGDLPALVATLAEYGGCAKVRTGGITPAAFPTPAALLDFIQTCVRANVPFKATAGLHHPLRAEYRLTYEPTSPTGTMYGFLNVFLAAAGLRSGWAEPDALSLLTESDPTSLHWHNDGVTWRDRPISNATLVTTRQHTAIAFGSCSFQEPLQDLRSLRWL